tara:strand:- start:841 stop:1287 length:447 start_codon:yes stop_codon:yes gene_type:complete
MKSLGMRTLQGVLSNNEGRILLSNEARGKGWQIRDIRCFPNRIEQLPSAPAPDYNAIRLATAGGLGTVSFSFEDNRVLGMASFVGGNHFATFDDKQLITNDLFILGKSIATVGDGDTAYQVTLEAFEISDSEEIMSIVKETAQSGTNS